MSIDFGSNVRNMGLQLFEVVGGSFYQKIQYNRFVINQIASIQESLHTERVSTKAIEAFGVQLLHAFDNVLSDSDMIVENFYQPKQLAEMIFEQTALSKRITKAYANNIIETLASALEDLFVQQKLYQKHQQRIDEINLNIFSDRREQISYKINDLEPIRKNRQPRPAP